MNVHKKKLTRTTAIFYFLVAISTVSVSSPKREFRGAWVATVTNLDWPASPYENSLSQQANLIQLIDELYQAGFNAILLQVRDECDAFYASHFEPWSYYLTSQQGSPPEPYFDPLELALTAAHQRGMELHAWINPYRAEVEIGNHPMAENHVTKRQPDWIFIKNNRKQLDPGIPQVREYVTNVVTDIVRHYDIDGIHFDDYFYPYEAMTKEDSLTFARHSRGFTKIADWRRDNVNLLIEQIYHAIQALKPHVKFGISPFGIWKNGVPAGIVGFSAYDGIYCDALAWFKAQIIDYLAPQCYWEIGGDQDYYKLVSWWAQQTNGRNLYIGHAGYKQKRWNRTEIPSQIRFNRRLENCTGSIIFRTNVGLLDNPQNLLDSLKNVLFKNPALSPRMPWKDDIAPLPPADLRYEQITCLAPPVFHWEAPSPAADGDTATHYVLYRFTQAPFDSAVFEDGSNIALVTAINQATPKNPLTSGPFYYQVRALDRLWNESPASNFIRVMPPAQPQLAFPPNHARNQPDSLMLLWYIQEMAAAYQLQLSADSTFAKMIIDTPEMSDTSLLICGLDGQQKYFWRVRALNAGGSGEYSSVFDFITGFPTTPQLAFPVNNADRLELNLCLVWNKTPGAELYELQIARSKLFWEKHIMMHFQEIADTVFSIGPLVPNRQYFWRIRAKNRYGTSAWSLIRTFITRPEPEVVIEPPLTFKLYQNYPNPFNTQTRIDYELPETAVVQLIVYNTQGQELEVLVNEQQTAGYYRIDWQASKWSSGVYFYHFRADDFSDIKKCILIR